MVRLRPVVGGSAENDQFYKYTPGGSIVLDTVNDAAIAQFEGATHFYVDFTPVPAPTEAEPGASS